MWLHIEKRVDGTINLWILIIVSVDVSFSQLVIFWIENTLFDDKKLGSWGHKTDCSIYLWIKKFHFSLISCKIKSNKKFHTACGQKLYSSFLIRISTSVDTPSSVQSYRHEHLQEHLASTLLYVYYYYCVTSPFVFHL